MAIHRHESLRRLGSVAGFVAVYAALTAAMYDRLSAPAKTTESRVEIVRGAAPPTRGVALKDGFFQVDNQPFLVKAVGWDPVRPGEYPWERKFNREELDSDLRRIREAGFNTVRTWAPLNAEELALAEKHGLRVLQGIWVDPAGDFADPSFRRQSLAAVTNAVEASRWSTAILGYLVLNEPRARSVAHAGLKNSSAFLREIAATVRALDPSAPIGYASWPGMEALDDELFDFIAFNIYPHRPRVVMDELGLVSYVRMLKNTVARGRPMIVSEFGISVSPNKSERDSERGGATEAEQARGLTELASTFLDAGAAGITVFQWSDGWWKNNEDSSDPQTHDQRDPEEWFGLVRYENEQDRFGTGRPALAEYANHQRALVTAPRSGVLTEATTKIRVATTESLSLRIALDNGSPFDVPLYPTGGGWLEGILHLPPDEQRHDVQMQLLTPEGQPLRTERRLLHRKSAVSRTIAVTPRRLTVRPGAPFNVEARVAGLQSAGASLSMATYTEDQYNEEWISQRADDSGIVRAQFRAPAEETILTVIAFEDEPTLPPAERAAAWMAVEVREER